jgi:hypothetical protein
MGLILCISEGSMDFWQEIPKKNGENWESTVTQCFGGGVGRLNCGCCIFRFDKWNDKKEIEDEKEKGRETTFFLFVEKIQFSPLNYNHFYGWSGPALWPPKLQKPLKKHILAKYPYNAPATCHFSIQKFKKINQKFKKIKNKLN